MARSISSRTLFFVTSPRTPAKMCPEIALLTDKFSGARWDRRTQCDFMKALAEADFFYGSGTNNPDFGARDRMNRGPQMLGFVALKPKIQLTEAGEALLAEGGFEEALLRQLLKFQLPSPFYVPTEEAAHFCCKPYLEILRLVRELGFLRFDELRIFGLQLTDYRNYDRVVEKVRAFRNTLKSGKETYKSLLSKTLDKEVREIYSGSIKAGSVKTRESAETSVEKFLRTKASNMRDYADACFRYLRATGLVNVSYSGRSLSIEKDKEADVDFILKSVEREPFSASDDLDYMDYLRNPTLPVLLSDNQQVLEDRLRSEFGQDTAGLNVGEMKRMLSRQTALRRERRVQEDVLSIKKYDQYDDIQETFKQIVADGVYDAPLVLEWNTWRAMTMLDGGDIRANLKFDDYGKPMSTALGNVPDIVCDYGEFLLMVEVTMASGQRQYEMEGEPVARHLGALKRSSGRPCYCLFVAPRINDAVVAYFYALHTVDISYYGGKSVLIPLPLDVFQKMLEESRRASCAPSPDKVRRFVEYSVVAAQESADEREWFDRIQVRAASWLV